MPEQTPVFPSGGSKMHKLAPSRDRADLRSATPAGFAQAIFESNHLRTLQQETAALLYWRRANND